MCETGAELIDARGLGLAVGPDFSAAVREELEDEGCGCAGELLLELKGSYERVEEDVNADEGPLFIGGDVVGKGFEFVGGLVGDRFELLGLLPEELGNCDGELFGAHFLGAGLFFVDVIGVDPFFDGFEPGVVDPFGVFIEAEVIEHEDGGEEEARGVSRVLAGTAGGRAVDRFEHGSVVADIG